MCDYFLQMMDDDNGDLTDIVRVGGRLPNADLEPFLDDDATNWRVDHLLSNSDFGDPFADLQDPLLKPYVAAGGATGFDHDGFGDRFQLLPPPPPPPPPPPKAVEQEMVNGAAAAAAATTSSILSKVHQISLSPLLPLLIRPTTPVAAGEITMKVISAGCPMAGAADHYGEAQISPHRATPGNKRRKGQAKRVVYVPAPAAASNRPSGEVVPSDLWAWRKYGQKPIKGSPYPRGYYRCSSSKGCSARKQVERSHTDPNMLVVTYTSEHNHPWPTQRNALAGSVRSPHSKAIKPPSTDTVAATDPIIPDAEAPPVSASPLVNEEPPVPAHFDPSVVCYKSMIPEADHPDDFFSDLAELESDPMSLIFSEGFMEGKTDAAAVGKATADPLFTMFD